MRLLLVPPLCWLALEVVWRVFRRSPWWPKGWPQ
jgi:hypothetical protein